MSMTTEQVLRRSGIEISTSVVWVGISIYNDWVAAAVLGAVWFGMFLSVLYLARAVEKSESEMQNWIKRN